MTDNLREAAQALLHALDFERRVLMEAPVGTPQRRRFKALYTVSSWIRIEVEALRAALASDAAGVAAGPQATPQVLAEDHTVLPVLQTGGSIAHLWVDVPPGTRVRVVAAPTSQEETTGI